MVNSDLAEDLAMEYRRLGTDGTADKTSEPGTTMLRTTMINQMLRRIQINDDVQYFAYGDSAYDPLNNSHI